MTQPSAGKKPGLNIITFYFHSRRKQIRLHLLSEHFKPEIRKVLEGLKMVTNCHLCSAEFKDKSRLVDHLAVIHKWLDQFYYKSIPLPEKSAKADNTAGVTGVATNSIFFCFFLVKNYSFACRANQ